MKRNERTTGEDTYAGALHATRTGSLDRSFHLVRFVAISSLIFLAFAWFSEIWGPCMAAIFVTALSENSCYIH